MMCDLAGHSYHKTENEINYGEDKTVLFFNGNMNASEDALKAVVG